MSVSDYDFNLLYGRIREMRDDLYKLRRDLDEVRRIAEEVQRKCQDRSSSPPESSTPTLPPSS